MCKDEKKMRNGGLKIYHSELSASKHLKQTYKKSNHSEWFLYSFTDCVFKLFLCNHNCKTVAFMINLAFLLNNMTLRMNITFLTFRDFIVSESATSQPAWKILSLFEILI